MKCMDPFYGHASNIFLTAHVYLRRNWLRLPEYLSRQPLWHNILCIFAFCVYCSAIRMMRSQKKMFPCLECLLNQSYKSKSRVSERVIWLAARRNSGLPLTFAIGNQWENHVKTASAKTQKYVSGYLWNILPYPHKKSFRQLQKFFFYTHILLLRSKSILQFLIRLYSLAKRCAKACNAFGCIWAKQQCQKCKSRQNGSQKNTDHIYFALAWSCVHKLHLQKKKTVQGCKSFFSYTWNVIYTFTNIFLHMQN